MDQSATGSLQLSKHRIEALVDGIFAVAMTLLVIDLRLPEHLHLGSDAELRAALLGLLPNFTSWVISFGVLGVFWAANNRLFSHLRHVDGALVWWTILMLGGASLLPFASAVNGHNLSQLAQGLYAAVMTLIAFGALMVARYIHRNPQLCVHPMDGPAYRATCVRLWGLSAIALLTVPLAGLAPGFANFAFVLAWILKPLSNAVARRSAAAPARHAA